jgi:hypothetical protein
MVDKDSLNKRLLDGLEEVGIICKTEEQVDAYLKSLEGKKFFIYDNEYIAYQDENSYNYFTGENLKVNIQNSIIYLENEINYLEKDILNSRKYIKCSEFEDSKDFYEKDINKQQDKINLFKFIISRLIIVSRKRRILEIEGLVKEINFIKEYKESLLKENEMLIEENRRFSGC